MLVFEFKAYGKSNQFSAVDEAIRTDQFVRNGCLRYWMDNPKMKKNDLNKYCNKYCAILAIDFPFADEINSMARQASAERAWSSISRFYDNCKKNVPGKKGYPFRKIAVRWNIKPLAGSLLTIGSLSTLPIKKGLDD